MNCILYLTKTFFFQSPLLKPSLIRQASSGRCMSALKLSCAGMWQKHTHNTSLNLRFLRFTVCLMVRAKKKGFCGSKNFEKVKKKTLPLTQVKGTHGVRAKCVLPISRPGVEAGELVCLECLVWSGKVVCLASCCCFWVRLVTVRVVFGPSRRVPTLPAWSVRIYLTVGWFELVTISADSTGLNSSLYHSAILHARSWKEQELEKLK